MKYKKKLKKRKKRKTYLSFSKKQKPKKRKCYQTNPNDYYLIFTHILFVFLNNLLRYQNLHTTSIYLIHLKFVVVLLENNRVRLFTHNYSLLVNVEKNFINLKY